MATSAADWVVGPGVCFEEVSHPEESILSIQDWMEGAGCCYAEAWRREPFFTLRQVEEPAVSQSCSPVILSRGLRKSSLSIPTAMKTNREKQQTCKEKVQLNTQMSQQISSEGKNYCHDFVVIGSGVAGLRYALAVAKHGSVAIVTKSEPQECNTFWAQGGISAVLDKEDSVEEHIQDTVVAGAFLCDKDAVRVVCSEGPERVKELITLGAVFDKRKDGELHLAREGGHSRNRIVHATDATGREVEETLLSAVSKHSNITIFSHHFALDLLTCQEGAIVTCYGVDTLDLQTGEVVRFLAGATMLASGGAGHIYPNTTNPIVATGDGIAMARRAKAIISNMEFMQFHPTALADQGLPKLPDKPRENVFLVTEAVRGSGGILYNQAMERFMPQYDSRNELAPRDIVARCIDDQLKKRGDAFVWLDISHAPREEIESHFPNVAAECLRCGIDITRQPIPVVPAMHYTCGGVWTGLQGETSIVGLYACGEVACTGLHGANRLASNSLLEGLVFAHRAVEPSVAHAKQREASLEFVAAEDAASCCWVRASSWLSLNAAQRELVLEVASTHRRRLQDIMWTNVGIVRSTERLKTADLELARLKESFESSLSKAGWQDCMASVEVCEFRNLYDVAELVVKSAAMRKESRGLHYTLDFKDAVESERHPTMLFSSISPVSQAVA